MDDGNEVFFLDDEMYEAHDALVCISAGEYVANENRRRFSINNRLKTEEEMVELFSDLPEALDNTVRIAKMCNYLSKKVDPLLPIFECPDGLTQDEYIPSIDSLKSSKEISFFALLRDIILPAPCGAE